MQFRSSCPFSHTQTSLSIIDAKEEEVWITINGKTKNLKNRKQAVKWNKHASEKEVQSQSKINKWSKIKLYNEMNRRQEKPRKQS